MRLPILGMRKEGSCGLFIPAIHWRSTSDVIGLKQNSNGKSGVVYVRTTGRNQNGDAVLSYCRWVMVRKRDLDAPAPETTFQSWQTVPAADLIDTGGLDFSAYDTTLAGKRIAGATIRWAK